MFPKEGAEGAGSSSGYPGPAEPSGARQILKMIVPPLIPQMVRALTADDDQDKLFCGYDQMFKRRLAECKVFGEYGCGASTLWVARHTGAHIISTDTSAFWLQTVQAQLPSPELCDLIHMDVGELGEWGRPLSYAHRAAFEAYQRAPWSRRLRPDTVLVDGRFRVACFLQSLLLSAPGTTIFFDDYVPRPHYHLVEEILPVIELEGNQARFVVPETFDRDLAEKELRMFRYVME